MGEIFGLFLLAILLLAVIIGLPIYVIYKIAQFGHVIDCLRREIDYLKGSRSVAQPGAAQPETAPPPTPERSQATILREISQPEVTVTPPPAAPPVAAAPLVQPAAPPPPPVTPAPARPDLEVTLGTKWLSVLGVVAIALATGFFLKHAFESGWIGPVARIITGLAGSAVMLGLGHYLSRKPLYRAWAQITASGGIILLFLTIWAGYSLYHLLDFYPAFGILVIAALAISAVAVRGDAQIVAVLSLLGAFITPALIQKGPATGNLTQLYIYLAGLNVWSALLVRFRPWHLLTLMSLSATWLVFILSGHLRGSNWLVAEAFAAFFLLFTFYDAAVSVRKINPEQPDWTDDIGTAFAFLGSIAFAGISIYVLADVYFFALPAVALAGVFMALLLLGLAAYYRPLPTAVSRDASSCRCLHQLPWRSCWVWRWLIRPQSSAPRCCRPLRSRSSFTCSFWC